MLNKKHSFIFCHLCWKLMSWKDEILDISQSCSFEALQVVLKTSCITRYTTRSFQKLFRNLQSVYKPYLYRLTWFTCTITICSVVFCKFSTSKLTIINMEKKLFGYNMHYQSVYLNIYQSLWFYVTLNYAWKLPIVYCEI